MGKIILTFDENGDTVNTKIEAQDVSLLHIELAVINLANTAADQMGLDSGEQFLMGVLAKLMDNREFEPEAEEATETKK